MSTKQLAAVIFFLGIALAVYLGLSMRDRAKVAATQADAAGALRTQWDAEKKALDDLRAESKSLTDFVGLWEPYFLLVEDGESGEAMISMKVRDAEMLNLSQRYEQLAHTINNKPNDTLPLLVRATLVFDDSYSKLLNWMGAIEDYQPTLRVGRVLLTGGSGAGGLRMEMVLEIPLRAKKPVKK